MYGYVLIIYLKITLQAKQISYDRGVKHFNFHQI